MTRSSSLATTSAHRRHSWSHTELVRRRHRGQRCNDVCFTVREYEASTLSPSTQSTDSRHRVSVTGEIKMRW